MRGGAFDGDSQRDRHRCLGSPRLVLSRRGRKRIRPPEVRRFVELLKGLSILEDGQPFFDTVSNVLPLARERDLSAYDAAYLDVAVRQGAPLATLDAALQKAGRTAGINIFK
jgi:predicted nucleic acid-binding protein